MKFVATVCIVLAVATGGYALHPPVESNQQNQSSAGGTTTTVSITSITTVDTAPEPSTVTLALLGLGGGAFYLRRRSR
jgi:MYXO-CTERM domain-containing protein